MASVASESQIFPPTRPLPGPRPAAQDQVATGAEPGGDFAKLLDSSPADDRESPVRAKGDRSDDTTAAKGNRRNDAAHAKRAKETPATDETSEPAEATNQVKIDKTSQDADKSADASSETAGAESPDATAEAGASADPTTDSAILTAAAAVAILPAITADAPVAAPTVASRGNFHGNILFISGRPPGQRRENPLEIACDPDLKLEPVTSAYLHGSLSQILSPDQYGRA